MKKRRIKIKINNFILLILILIIFLMFKSLFNNINKYLDCKTFVINKDELVGYRIMTEEEYLASITITEKYSLTSYYYGDPMSSTTCTGSGLCTNDFQINNNGWYTYEGKIVLASATTYMLKYGYDLVENKKYFRYGNEVKIEIDNISYNGIILDSCGNCTSSKYNVIDIFVSDSSCSITKNGNNKINVSWIER